MSLTSCDYCGGFDRGAISLADSTQQKLPKISGSADGRFFRGPFVRLKTSTIAPAWLKLTVFEPQFLLNKTASQFLTQVVRTSSDKWKMDNFRMIKELFERKKEFSTKYQTIFVKVSSTKCVRNKCNFYAFIK